MTRYTADSRDRVRDAVDMIAVVSDRTELRRAGATEYVGRCPFHDERTPSFGVNPIEKVYYCFGCQASGDVFTFVMETEGLDFTGALESLAGRFGVELQTEQEDPQAASRRQRRERLQSLLGRATTYYARYLWEAREATGAREYLLGRGLREDSLREFRVGYAPSAWDRILPLRGAPVTATMSCSRSDWLSARRTVPARSTTASASASCFPRPTRGATWWASARAPCAKTSARST